MDNRLQGYIKIMCSGYVFIRVEPEGIRQDFFMHRSEIDRPLREVVEGDPIEFTPILITEGKHEGKWKGEEGKILLGLATGDNNNQKESV